MGLAVGPRSGPSHLVVGDAGGMINPFNGEGIAYGYETGRLAAEIIGEALSTVGPAPLTTYEAELQARYGIYYRIARGFVDAISRPQVMRATVGLGMHSRAVMAGLLRIMSNMMRPGHPGPAEGAYGALSRVARARQG